MALFAVPFAGAVLIGALDACGGDDDAVTGGTDASTDGGTGPGNVDGSSGSVPGEGGIVVTPPGPLDPTVALRAATIIASCISDDGVNRTLQELYLDRITDPRHSPAVLACLAGATNGCRALDDCYGLRISSDPQCDGGCAGNVLHQCGDGKRHYVQDCSRIGYACISSDRGRCAPPGTEACDPATYENKCADGVAVGCSGGAVARGFPCADYNATCQLSYTLGSDPSISVYGCRGAGGKCEGTTNVGPEELIFEGDHCEGDKLVACLSNGLGVLDCASSGNGFRCIPSPDAGMNARAYCGTATECTPKGPFDKVKAACEGTSIVACNGGKIEKVDCASLGFTACENGVCTPGLVATP